MRYDELIAAHDLLAESTVIGTRFYLDEIKARDAERATDSMVRMTKLITILTFVITAVTIVNVIVFLNDSPTIPGFIQ